MMKAVAFKYKTEEINVVDIPKPKLGNEELLIKVKYSALDTALDAVAYGKFEAGFLHEIKDPLVLGWHYSGRIEKIGSCVEKDTFEVGDEVFGHLQYNGKTSQGSLSEYVTVKADSCTLKPIKVSADVAAASTTETLTALQALCDEGGLRKSSSSNKKSSKQTAASVLVNGAAGGVGSAAVQIAKQLGATVTAICSTKDVDRVKKFGADVVIDRKQSTDFLDRLLLESNRFDVVFDTPSVLPAAKTLKLLQPTGRLVLTVPRLNIWWGLLCSLFTRKAIRMLMVESKKEDLDLVASWLTNGCVDVDIDSTFKVKDIGEAAARNRNRDKRGRVVVQVDGGW